MSQQNPQDPQTIPDPASLPELNNIEHADNHMWPLRRAARNGGIVVGIFIILSLMIWGAVDDLPGLWGALIGGAIGGAFMLLTVLAVLLTANSNPTTTLGAVLGSWLVKVAVVLIVLLVMQDMDFYSRPALAITIIVTMVAALATETYAVTKTQRLYVGS